MTDEEKAAQAAYSKAAFRREEETGKLILTTSYAEILGAGHALPERFLVVIPVSEIVSARHFDPGAYSHFQARENDARPATA